MKTLENKIDFAVVFAVKNANPNGDPLNGNRPRETYEGLGEVSDVCLKRKIRNRLIDMGEKIFVQSDDKRVDGYKSLSDRAKGFDGIKNAGKDSEAYAKAACQEWIDVRSFGQVFAFKDDKNSTSVGVRGPVSIHPAFSVDPIVVDELQIIKSVNNITGDKKGPDTMGLKSRIGFGIYSFCGSINCQLAEKTEFSDGDAEKIHQALCTLFENDASSARPEGSMEVLKVYWWKHNNKTGQYSTAKVHRSIHITKNKNIPTSALDYDILVEDLPGLTCEIYEGL